MTRMIERWFPCKEVSENSGSGWGSSNTEIRMFPWFAKRPVAQARAAVLTALLQWPEDASEQAALQLEVAAAMSGRDSISAALLRRIPAGAKIMDPFSGRGLIPLEAAHLGARTFANDYSPVACLATRILVSHPSTDWTQEPPLPLPSYEPNPIADRLPHDVEFVLDLIDERTKEILREAYPSHGGCQPWAYLWSTAVPCQECGMFFPILASLELRRPSTKAKDKGQSLSLRVTAGTLFVDVITGLPTSDPTLVAPPGQSKHSSKGKVAVCPACHHPHDKTVTNRIAQESGTDQLLAVCEGERVFRSPTPTDSAGIDRVEPLLSQLGPDSTGLSAVIDEAIPPQFGWTIQGQAYGITRYADLSIRRQNLLFAVTARAIADLGDELIQGGISYEYACCLVDYACSVMCRRLKFSTRGAHLRLSGGAISDVFGNTESSWSYNFDCLETGLGTGPGTWSSLASNTLTTLRSVVSRKADSQPAQVTRGTATALPFPDRYFDAIVTDPPYDEMIDYADASDLYFAWLKRASGRLYPELLVGLDDHGLQPKTHEMIVKKGRPVGDHRTRDHYDLGLQTAFTEASRTLKPDGVLVIVFGHGEVEVWNRLLSAIKGAGLVLTGSWPARTEKKTGGANIETTLTLACRKVGAGREPGRQSDVDAEVRREIRGRVSGWDAAGLALTDQLMASAGPALEVVGRYSEVLDKTGGPVDLDRYLPLARRFVEEAADIKIDTLPLETFDARTRFALFWVRLYGREIAAASEARWQRLASDLSESDTAKLLKKDGKGIRLAFADEAMLEVHGESPVIDVALAVAAAGKSVAGIAEVLLRVGRIEDPFVWASMGELARLVPETDRDGEVWTWAVRNQSAITGASRNVEAARIREEQAQEDEARQGSLFGGDE